MPNPSRRRRQLAKAALVLTLVLAAPIVPAFACGEFFGDWADAWRANPPAKLTAAGLIAGVLALDILLPVPSAPLNTLAGALLGFVPATLVCWAGMTLGSALAFGAARLWGPAFVSRLMDLDDLAELRKTTGSGIAWLLLASRPAPVLAEATVLLAGLIGAPARPCLGAIAAGNLIVAVVYAAAGHWASFGPWLTPTLAASALAPLLLGVLLRGKLSGDSHFFG